MNLNRRDILAAAEWRLFMIHRKDDTELSPEEYLIGLVIERLGFFKKKYTPNSLLVG